jgi:DNA mismatch endonuclease (patch repair protein)
MTDIVNSETRSRMMSGIRGKNTKPELKIRSELHKLGFRYRLHDKRLPGNPDIVFKRYRAVILVHGCFWHRHGCHLFKWPKTRPEFWKKKIDRNHENDLKAFQDLQSSGLRVCIVWECAIKGANKNIQEIARTIAKWLKSNKPVLEISG